MSDTILRLIPLDPSWTTDESRLHHAQAILKSLLSSTAEVTARLSPEIEFVDAGENGGDIWCPTCGALLENDWWVEQVGAAFEEQFSNLTVFTPCCGTESSLNNLRYEAPVGFAKVIMEVLNPEQAVELEQIEQALGCRLRAIWAYI